MKISNNSCHPSRPFILKDLKQSEEIMGCKFPKELRDFFFKYAGCIPEQTVFDIQGLDESPDDAIDYFLGSENNSLSTIVEDMSSHLFSSFVPIAQCGFGDFVCYSLSSEDPGSIWYWYHEDEREDPDCSDRSNYYKCADSLQEFLDRLYEGNDEDVNELLSYDDDDDPVERAHLLLISELDEAIERFFETRPDFEHEANSQWTRKLPTVYQTVCWSYYKSDDDDEDYDDDDEDEDEDEEYDDDDDDESPCVELYVVFSPKSAFAIWGAIIENSRFQSALKKLEKFAEYNMFWQGQRRHRCFSFEKGIDSIAMFLDKKLGSGWRKRNDPKEMSRALKEFNQAIIKKGLSRLLSYCDEYSDEKSLYEGYLGKAIPPAAVRSTRVPFEFYLATWFYRQKRCVEAFNYVNAYLVHFEQLPEREQKCGDNACFGQFAKYVRDYLATLIESSK